MPELSRVCDPFSDAVKAFTFGDTLGQTNGNEFDDGRNHTQQRLRNPDFDHEVYKPMRHGDDHRSKVIGTSSDNSPSDLDMFMRPTYYSSTENDLGKLQQPGNVYSPFGDNQNYPPLQLDVSEIYGIPWISDDILEDFPPFTTPEVPTISSVNNVTFDIPPRPSDFSSPLSLPISHVASTPPSTTATPSTSNSSAVASPNTPCENKTPPLPSSTTPSTSRTPRVSSPTLPQPGTPPTRRLASMRISTPSMSAAVPIPIPEEGLTTPVSQTLEALKPQSRIRKNPRGPKKTNNVEQLEHVRRERKRRDDMSFKISTLESLLPPAGPNLKRDRASIVHDSVHYVRSLQQELDELKKKHADLELNKSGERLPITAMISNEKQNLASEEKGVKLMEYQIQVEGDTESAARLEKCRCRPDHMSRAMKVMEQLNLDVRRCTITKMYSYSTCLIMAKPRLPSSSPMSSASVVAALRSSITIA